MLFINTLLAGILNGLIDSFTFGSIICSIDTIESIKNPTSQNIRIIMPCSQVSLPVFRSYICAYLAHILHYISLCKVTHFFHFLTEKIVSLLCNVVIFLRSADNETTSLRDHKTASAPDRRPLSVVLKNVM